MIKKNKIFIALFLALTMMPVSSFADCKEIQVTDGSPSDEDIFLDKYPNYRQNPKPNALVCSKNNCANEYVYVDLQHFYQGTNQGKAETRNRQVFKCELGFNDHWDAHIVPAKVPECPDGKKPSGYEMTEDNLAGKKVNVNYAENNKGAYYTSVCRVTKTEEPVAAAAKPAEQPKKAEPAKKPAEPAKPAEQPKKTEPAKKPAAKPAEQKKAEQPKKAEPAKPAPAPAPKGCVYITPTGDVNSDKYVYLNNAVRTTDEPIKATQALACGGDACAEGTWIYLLRGTFFKGSPAEVQAYQCVSGNKWVEKEKQDVPICMNTNGFKESPMAKGIYYKDNPQNSEGQKGAYVDVCLDDEAEQIIEPVKSAYESQKPFVEGSSFKEFTIYKLLVGQDKSENEQEFEEWKKECETIAKENHVDKVEINVITDKNDIQKHKCVAKTCNPQEGYAPETKFPACLEKAQEPKAAEQSENNGKNTFVEMAKKLHNAFDGLVTNKKAAECANQNTEQANAKNQQPEGEQQ